MQVQHDSKAVQASEWACCSAFQQCAHRRISWTRPILPLDVCMTSTTCLMALLAISFSSTPPTNTCTCARMYTTLRLKSPDAEVSLTLATKRREAVVVAQQKSRVRATKDTKVEAVSAPVWAGPV